MFGVVATVRILGPPAADCVVEEGGLQGRVSADPSFDGRQVPATRLRCLRAVP